MKKILSILLSLVLLTTLISCAPDTEEPIDPNASLNDKYYSLQEYIKVHNATSVIKKYKGKGVKVAIIDSGYYSSSKDLDYNSIKKGTNYTIESYKDGYGHGTSTLSIIKSIQNNSIGIAGMVPSALVYEYKVFDSSGSGCTSEIIARAINQAVVDGCDVINLSLGSPSYSALEASAIDNAIANGIIIVASAGNTGDSTPNYPANFPDVINVGSCDMNGDVSYFSNTNGVDCLAVGEEVYVMNNKGKYEYLSGTSFSAPIISSLAVICKQIDPNINSDDFMKILKNSGTSKKKTKSKGYGVINFKKAVEYTKKHKKSTNVLNDASRTTRYYPIGSVED